MRAAGSDGRPPSILGAHYRDGVGFSRAELEAFRDATLPDLIGPGLRLLFVGINPGLWTAAVQTHFARPGNRFYPALRRAGVLTRDINLARGMTDDDRRHFLDRGLGITNLVPRATARADELTPTELREGSLRLTEVVRTWQPRVVAVLGISAYRTAFGVPKAQTGEQPHLLDDARLWVVPNPSGLNAHDTIASLAVAYAAPARAAGVLASD